ncbi:DUF4255 domain-containing protein [uncultured Roseobacter sp.]|uniref:DUF4255 domain-containing protein n=1 Tax=uncultured Roseobacter sp. TaxID=114847 RepID=UPI002604A9A8|nr:DUF4255 domain-containing protein [uncultured Roseobacter sp.]
MIDQALTLVSDRLNAHLSALFSVSEDLVAVGPLSDAEGKPTAEARNRLTLFLTNIAQDSVPRGGRPRGSLQIGQAPPVHLDVYFMLASGHDPEIYGEGLKLISAALMFFQANPVMTPQLVPEMPDGISQLTVEISNLKVEEVGQLWGNLGGRYVPSVMFKMRSVMIDAGAIRSIVPLIRAPGGETRPRETS